MFFLKKSCLSLFLILSLTTFLSANTRPFVVGQLECELGNNLFQVATTCALAWDHDADPLFPDLITRTADNMPLNYQHVFFRCNPSPPMNSISLRWTHPIQANFCYVPIPYQPDMSIRGVFQSEKYFAHHRERLLELFAPHPDDLSYMQNKYSYVLNHPQTVGVQIRWFGRNHDAGWWSNLAQYGADYLEKAVALFPEDSLFIVSTNNYEFARRNFPKGLKNVHFLEAEPHYIDLYLLSMCKNIIISNSTFGWWAAWLNKNPNKIVVAPYHWVNPAEYAVTPYDVIPEGWIKLDAKWEPPQGTVKEIR